jgi:hypothetical protein
MKTQVFKTTLFLFAFILVGNAFAYNNSRVNPYDEETIHEIVLDIKKIENSPTVTLINKYGEVIAQFYGDKGEIKSKFSEALGKTTFILNHGNHYFYLVD